jgi:hypothetical protein
MAALAVAVAFLQPLPLLQAEAETLLLLAHLRVTTAALAHTIPALMARAVAVVVRARLEEMALCRVSAATAAQARRQQFPVRLLHTQAVVAAH